MTSSKDVVALEKSRSRWRMGAIGALGVLAGAVMAGSISNEQAPTEVASVVLQDGKSSGRWNATLLAVMENGDIMYLDTSRAQSTWVQFQYSPNFRRSP